MDKTTIFNKMASTPRVMIFPQTIMNHVKMAFGCRYLCLCFYCHLALALGLASTLLCAETTEAVQLHLQVKWRSKSQTRKMDRRTVVPSPSPS